MPEHSILCAAYPTPMSTLFPGSVPPCDCGAVPAQAVAVAVAEPPAPELSSEKWRIDGAGTQAAPTPPAAATVPPPAAPPPIASQPAAPPAAAAPPETPTEKPKKTRAKRQKKAETAPPAVEPKAESATPLVAEPKAEEPKAEEPKAEEHKAEEPKTETKEEPLVHPTPGVVAAVRAATGLPPDDPTRIALTATVTETKSVETPAAPAESKPQSEQPLAAAAPSQSAAAPSVECQEAKAKADYFAAAGVVTLPAQPEAKAVSSTPAKKRLYAGIDPDLQGYVSVLDSTGAIVLCRAIPTTGGQKPVYDEPGMVRLALELKALGVEEVLLERQQPINKINRGEKVVNITAKANFKKGYSYGLWRGILGALGIAFDTIAPITWKRAMAIAGGGPDEVKKRAIDKAQGIFPGIDLRDIERKPKARVPCGSKAESLLLARYVMLTKTGGLTAVRDAEKELEDQDDDVAAEDELKDDQHETNEQTSTSHLLPGESVDLGGMQRDPVTGTWKEAPAEQPKLEPEQSKADEPKADEPKAEEPKAEEPKAEEPPVQHEPESDESAKDPADGKESEQEWLQKMSAFMKSGKTIPGAQKARLKNIKPVKASGSRARKAPPAKAKPKIASRKTKVTARPKAKVASARPKKAVKRPSGPKKPMTAAERAMARVLRGL